MMTAHSRRRSRRCFLNRLKVILSLVTNWLIGARTRFFAVVATPRSNSANGNVGANPHHVADSPSIFAEHLRYVLDREFERNAQTISRAESIGKMQTSMLTIVLAAIVFICRDGHRVTITPATTWTFGISIAAAVISLLLATWARSGAIKTSGTDDKTLDSMVGERWHNSPEALFIVAKRHRQSIKQLRIHNKRRSRLADVALYFQAGFIVLAVTAVGYEVASRVGWV